MTARAIRRTVPLLLACLLLAGCWDYRGLNELTIVTGIAVDTVEEGEGFALTFEIVDMSTEGDSEYNSTLLVTEGDTVAEAVYDANVKLHNNMYLGNAEVVIVSREVAEETGLDALLDYLLRDQDARDNLHIVVADMDRAGDLLTPAEDEEEGGILSFSLSESLDQHARGSGGSTNAVESYEIYNILALGTSSLALPVIVEAEEGDEPFQLDGMALFTEDKMTGRLPEEDMPFYLLAVDSVQGGGYPVDGVDGGEARIVLTNRRSRPKIDFAYEGGDLSFTVSIRMEADVIELSGYEGQLDGAAIRAIEAAAGESLASGVEDLLSRLRDEGYDVLGLADTVRGRDHDLWTALEKGWAEAYADCDIRVEVQVDVDNTGMIEQYGRE